MEVTLREVTRDNYEEVCELEIPQEQQQHLSENVWSVVESRFYPHSHRPRAIYFGDEVAGFVMWGIFPDEFTDRDALIFRFMVAHKYQKQGIGRAALLKTIEEIGCLGFIDNVFICYSLKNTVAKALYASVGFVEAELSDDGSEVLAKMALPVKQEGAPQKYDGDLIVLADKYLEEMLAAHKTGDYELYVKRQHKAGLAGFTEDKFHNENLSMRNDLGAYRKREYFGSLSENSDTDYPRLTRFVWKCVFEKREVIITVSLFNRDGDWYVKERTVS